MSEELSLFRAKAELVNEQARILREAAARAMAAGINISPPGLAEREEKRLQGESRHWPRLTREEAWARHEEDQTRKRQAYVERRHARSSRQTARRRGAAGLARGRTTDLFARSDGKCYLCGHLLDVNDYHVDHIIPIRHGGTHTEENLAATCPQCNIRKSDQSVSLTVRTRQAVLRQL